MSDWNDKETAREGLEIMVHALGLKRGNGVSYRNHFVTGGPDTDNWATIQAMVDCGMMAQQKTPAFLPPDDRCFYVTERGKEHAQRFYERDNQAPTRSESETGRE